jgi:hypothetical protein
VYVHVLQREQSFETYKDWNAMLLVCSKHREDGMESEWLSGSRSIALRQKHIHTTIRVLVMYVLDTQVYKFCRNMSA